MQRALPMGEDPRQLPQNRLKGPKSSDVINPSNESKGSVNSKESASAVKVPDVNVNRTQEGSAEKANSAVDSAGYDMASVQKYVDENKSVVKTDLRSVEDAKFMYNPKSPMGDIRNQNRAEGDAPTQAIGDIPKTTATVVSKISTGTVAKQPPDVVSKQQNGAAPKPRGGASKKSKDGAPKQPMGNAAKPPIASAPKQPSGDGRDTKPPLIGSKDKLTQVLRQICL
ncbi:unnamed protein product [Heligmosomoides polygyrus]|uniref:Uncharacterized protein n=1 Tax=Heligmosomoides polygyrus TaxID=6339 RepID=A0A183GQD1_HELPZ|nr:unnamed protein product [Heligmosomoides polygyrus]